MGLRVTGILRSGVSSNTIAAKTLLRMGLKPLILLMVLQMVFIILQDNFTRIRTGDSQRLDDLKPFPQLIMAKI